MNWPINHNYINLNNLFIQNIFSHKQNNIIRYLPFLTLSGAPGHFLYSGGLDVRGGVAHLSPLTRLSLEFDDPVTLVGIGVGLVFSGICVVCWFNLL